MKKLLFLSLFVLGFAVVDANAQKAEKVTIEEVATAADVASADENIISKVCQHSGTTSYYQKSVCEKSGSTTMTKVVFDAESSSFIAPVTTGAKKSCAGDKTKGCAKGAKKGCDKGAKKACDKGAKKACDKGAKKACAGDKGAKKAACCKGGKKKGCSKSNSKTK